MQRLAERTSRGVFVLLRSVVKCAPLLFVESEIIGFVVLQISNFAA